MIYKIHQINLLTVGIVMSKKVIMIMIAALLAISVFVSCDQGIKLLKSESSIHIDSNTTTLKGGNTYFLNINETVEVAERMVIEGTDPVTIYLDKCSSLFADQGISVLHGQTLIIQSGDRYSSRLYASYDAPVANAAGIGGFNTGESCGTVIIKGLVDVFSKGGDSAAGIGGANGGSGGKVEIQLASYDDTGSYGAVYAHGGSNAPGIGGGVGGTESNIKFVSGYVAGAAGAGYPNGILVSDGGASLVLSPESEVKLKDSESDPSWWAVLPAGEYYGEMKPYMVLNTYSFAQAQASENVFSMYCRLF